MGHAPRLTVKSRATAATKPTSNEEDHPTNIPKDWLLDDSEGTEGSHRPTPIFSMPMPYPYHSKACSLCTCNAQKVHLLPNLISGQLWSHAYALI